MDDIIVQNVSQYIDVPTLVSLMLAQKSFNNDLLLKERLQNMKAFHFVKTYEMNQMVCDNPRLAKITHPADGTTLLHHIESIFNFKTLVEYGADINKQDKLGNTPLHHAATIVPKIKWLLSMNADSTIRNHQGQIPFDLTDSIIGRSLLRV